MLNVLLVLTLVTYASCESSRVSLDFTSGVILSHETVDHLGSSGDEIITDVTTRTTPTRKVGETGGKVLKRTKRYLTFPEGSTFSFAFCMTVKVLTPDDPDIFSEAVALATSYDLPNNTRALGLFPEDEKKEATKLSRKQRSYVYSKAESILDRLGIAGRSCVLRAICEGAQQLRPADNILTEIIRIVLSDKANPLHPSFPSAVLSVTVYCVYKSIQVQNQP
ncbi:hypothetical protein GE061_011549 [Apolygus lucorum]|uniref:Uncharacterized protein n=1 Tax=Apolygus lucorum TaxID=248454 RepID=A0A8S9XY47_APOLU|nr:hypothetical protein GE061_011549 [Apolygus lucorum]